MSLAVALRTSGNVERVCRGTGATYASATKGEDPFWRRVSCSLFRWQADCDAGGFVPSEESSTMKAKDIMTKKPKTVTQDTSVREAARIMKEEGVGVLPVVERDGS